MSFFLSTLPLLLIHLALPPMIVHCAYLAFLSKLLQYHTSFRKASVCTLLIIGFFFYFFVCSYYHVAISVSLEFHCQFISFSGWHSKPFHFGLYASQFNGKHGKNSFILCHCNRYKINHSRLCSATE